MSQGTSKKRPPLLSFVEMAFEFDVSQQKLKKLMGDVKNPAPRFVRRHLSGTSRSTTYYNAAAMRQWWADKKETA